MADGSFVVLRNFINGEFADAADGNWLENIEPATGQVHYVFTNTTMSLKR